MENIAPQTTLIDLEYLGYPKVIASCLLESQGRYALVDPGLQSPGRRLKPCSRRAFISGSHIDASIGP